MMPKAGKYLVIEFWKLSILEYKRASDLQKVRQSVNRIDSQLAEVTAKKNLKVAARTIEWL